MTTKRIRIVALVLLALLLLILATTLVPGEAPADAHGLCLTLVGGAALLAGGVWWKSLSRLASPPNRE
jgi:hypothetical protein